MSVYHKYEKRDTICISLVIKKGGDMKKYKYQFIGVITGYILSIVILLKFVIKLNINRIELTIVSFLLTFSVTYLGNIIGKIIDYYRNRRNKND